MKISLKKKMFVMLFVGIALLVSNGMVSQTLNFDAKKSSIVIEGKSSMHDWTSKVSEVPGQAVVDVASKTLKSLSLEFPVTSIRSDEKVMDKKTYETFKSDKNPKISFKMTQVTSAKVNADKSVSITLVGTLTMGGGSKSVTVTTVGKPSGANAYVFTGSVPIKMTDFGMKPPTAMLVMKVKDDVVIKFNITVDGVSSSAL